MWHCDGVAPAGPCHAGSRAGAGRQDQGGDGACDGEQCPHGGCQGVCMRWVCMVVCICMGCVSVCACVYVRVRACVCVCILAHSIRMVCACGVPAYCGCTAGQLTVPTWCVRVVCLHTVGALRDSLQCPHGGSMSCMCWLYCKSDSSAKEAKRVSNGLS